MSPVSNIAKVPTGIQGFDEVTRGGLPRGRTTLVIGGPGAGKTIFALQTLASAARDLDEPGIFVAFEESSDRIRANAASLALGLENLSGEKLAFVDAQPSPDVILSGPCDLGGMLAALTGKVQQIGATRIVFDSIDALLDLVGDATAQRRELYRLHDWLIQSGLTAIITARSAEAKGAAATLEAGMQFAPFLVDCAIALRHHVESGISQRRLRVLKYRGSHFAENEAPFLIGPNGFEVAYIEAERSVEASTERVSSGVERLDTMLSGGYYRAASILITGVPGTAKSTLAGSFIAAACQRGERAVYVGFDENCEEMVRNLASVNIQLRPHLESGLLRMLSRRAPAASAEEHLLRIKAVVREHRPRCIAIDPLSALAQPKDAGAGQGVAARLVQWMKSEGVTLVCTSLLAHADPHVEETALEISTVADTWIHVSYSVQAGERNRALTIVKSRGTRHSNQVRELVLSDEGVSLADVYTSGGEVLMGTMRWQKEAADRVLREHAECAARQEQARVEVELTDLAAQISALQKQAELKRVEQQQLATAHRVESDQALAHQDSMARLRRRDIAGNTKAGEEPSREP